jgi:glycerol uptake facilitator-like aquaporin
MFILQGAIFAGMLIYAIGLGLIVLFSIPFASIYIRLGKKKFLMNIPDKITFKEVLLYIIGTSLGFITASILVFILLYIFIFFMDKSGFTFD